MPHLTPGDVARILAQLDREEAFFVRLAEVVRGLRPKSLREAAAAWPSEFEALQAEADALGRQRHELQRLLRRHAPAAGAIPLTELPLTGATRAAVSRRRRDVKRAAAQAAGMLRGLMAALSVWNDTTRAALDALLGVSPREATYSSSGRRVAPARPVLLESRS